MQDRTAIDAVVYSKVRNGGPGMHVREQAADISRGVLRLSSLDYVWDGGSHGLEMHRGPYDEGNWWFREVMPPADLLRSRWFRDTFWSRRGFVACTQRAPSIRPGGRIDYLAFPLWVPAALLATLPAVRAFRGAFGRHRTGRCPRCGYDLTGNESGVCPECGTATP